MAIRLLEPRTIAGYRYGEGTILDLQDDKEEEYLVDRAIAEWYADSTNGLVKENNLSDVPDKPTARDNLGVGELFLQGSDTTRTLAFGGGGAGQTGYSTGTRGLDIGLASGNSVPAVGTSIDYNRISVLADTADGTAGGGTKVNGLFVRHAFGDSTTKGGRHAIYGACLQNAVTSSSNTDRNYVGAVGQTITAVGDGGGAGTEKGAYFGGNFYARQDSGATYTANITGAEFNSIIKTGASSKYRSGLQIAGGGDVRGTSYDAGLSISSLGSSTTTFESGILVSSANGANALGTDSTILKCSQAGSILDGIAITSPVTGKILSYVNGSNSVSVTPTSFSGNSSNFGFEVGRVGTSNSPYIDFHSSASTTDYDARILASGGTAATGGGTLTYTAATHSFTGGLKFGTYTADAAATIAGYITITDAGGTTRKLLVAA